MDASKHPGPSIVFRADASSLIGTGHVMRCLTLAVHLRERGAHTSFVCRPLPSALEALICSHGIQIHTLSPTTQHSVPDPDIPYADWLGTTWECDAEQTRDALMENDVAWIVVDHYALDARWEEAIKPYVRQVMAIDDLADRRHSCDLLLDQNLYSEGAERYKGLVPASCELLLGPYFALLREEFREMRQALRHRDGRVHRVLVFFGGSDPTNETEKALDAISTLPSDLGFDIVVGSANPQAQAIAARCATMANVHYIGPVNDMAQRMDIADIALGAGGSTSWERCCLGLPTILVGVAANQEPIAHALAAVGGATYLGPSAQVTRSSIAEALLVLARSPSRVREMAEIGMKLVDGCGANRVAERLLASPGGS